MPITYAYLQLFVKLTCQLGRPLADTANPRNSVTFNIIPITSCGLRKNTFFLYSMHHCVLLLIFPIRFTWSPVYVVWNWGVVPTEVFCCMPFQPDPNLIHWWFLLAKLKDKVVLLSAVYLYQIFAQGFAVLKCLVKRRHGSAHQVTVVVKSPPAIGTRLTWKRMASTWLNNLQVEFFGIFTSSSYSYSKVTRKLHDRVGF